jgi:hypothetical protein
MTPLSLQRLSRVSARDTLSGFRRLNGISKAASFEWTRCFHIASGNFSPVQAQHGQPIVHPLLPKDAYTEGKKLDKKHLGPKSLNLVFDPASAEVPEQMNINA